MPRTWVEVDLGALVSNARTIAPVAPPARLLAMVKANAYGLGAVEVARALEAVDPWGFGVATLAEGRELRAADIARPILVFGPLAEDELRAAAAADLRPALGSEEQLGRWLALAPGRPFHLEVDTGMARTGIWWEALERVAGRLAAAPGFEGIFTHFHSADTDPGSVREQWSRFQAALARLPSRPPLVHAANSAAALRYPETRADLVRPGIFLYGGGAGGGSERVGGAGSGGATSSGGLPAGAVPSPRRVVSWRARVGQADWRDAGATVSYGATYRAAARTAVATLTVGYADGLPLALSNVGEVLIGGRRSRIAGRVTMDLTMVVCERLPDIGAVATLIGRDGEEELTLDEVAGAARSIPYELLTGLGTRVERLYR